MPPHPQHPQRHFALYLEFTRQVSERRERMQLFVLPPLGSSQYPYWTRVQEHATHRTRWRRGAAPVHNLVARTIRPYANRAGWVDGYWTMSPLITREYSRADVLSATRETSLPYRMMDQMKAHALAVHRLDVS